MHQISEYKTPLQEFSYIFYKNAVISLLLLGKSMQGRPSYMLTNNKASTKKSQMAF